MDEQDYAKSFGPNTIRVMRRAYKDAVSEAAARYPSRSLSSIRYQIAKFIIGAARVGMRGDRAIKEHALENLNDIEGKR